MHIDNADIVPCMAHSNYVAIHESIQANTIIKGVPWAMAHMHKHPWVYHMPDIYLIKEGIFF